VRKIVALLRCLLNDLPEGVDVFWMYSLVHHEIHRRRYRSAQSAPDVPIR
jgi:hypothetical protein